MINKYIKTQRIFALLLVITLVPLSINAQWSQIGSTLFGEDVGNNFGFSISLSANGNIMAVGATTNNDGGAHAGHVRVFENNSGTWTQIGTDIDGSTNQNHGYSVSLSADGSILAVSAILSNNTAGHVKIYQNNGGTWTQIGNTINGDAANDQSGFVIDLSDDGSIVAVGARLNDGGGTNSGHVKVYQNNGGTWTQIGSDIEGSNANDVFGSSLSLSANGNILAVGARFNNSSNSGYVRVFENNGGSWSQIGSDLVGASGDFFADVSLNGAGSLLAVGASGGNYAKIYENNNGTWTQVGNTINGENAGEGMSVSISVDGSTVAVGSILNSDAAYRAGKVRVFQNNSGTWTQVGNGILGDAANDWFGSPLTLSSDGSILAIAAPTSDTNGVNRGHVKVFASPTLSLEQNSFGSHFSIAPNPSFGVSVIQMGEKYNAIELSVYNILGELVTTQKHSQTDSIKIDTRSLQSGVYLVKLQSEAKKATVRLIVN